MNLCKLLEIGVLPGTWKKQIKISSRGAILHPKIQRILIKDFSSKI
jgi:hypothetical protein